MREQRLQRQFLQDVQRRHRAPGDIDTWAASLLVIAAVLTPLLVASALYLCWRGLALRDQPPDPWLFCHVPTVAVAAFIGLCLLRAGTVSRWIRLSVLIPILHLGIFGLAWSLWHVFAARIGEAPSRLELVERLPAPTIALVLGVLVVLGSLSPRSLQRRARAPRWLHHVTVFALLHLLLLGLWLPLAAAGWSHLLATPHANVAIAADVTTFAWLVIAPPTALALLLSACNALRPRAFARRTIELMTLGIMLFIIALIFRLGGNFEAYVGYANLVHVLLSQALFCLFCIGALAVAHWRSLRTPALARRDNCARPLRGVVEGDGVSPVGQIEYVGWLGGLETHLRGFRLHTAHGELEVPEGSTLIAPVPQWTTSAGAGETATVLSASDEVVVSGFVAPVGDTSPYRQRSMPVPGTDGIVVTTARSTSETISRDVLLLVWRPCVFYLLVATAVALPGIATFASL